MAVVAPTAVGALPTPPDPSSPATFDSRATAFVAAQAGAYLTGMNNLAANVYNNAIEAQIVADASTASANAAAASSSAASGFATQAANNVGAALWVSGTTYALGACVWSPISRLVYRRIVAGAGTTDPSADSTNWALPGTITLTTPIVIVSSTPVTATAGSHHILTYAGVTTLNLPAAPADGDTVWITVANGRLDNIVGRNLKSIMGVAEDMTLNTQTGVQLRYINSTVQWRIL